MIWHSSRDLSWSKILMGWESPSIGQWNTEVSVTMAIVFELIHFQNTTSSFRMWAFILHFLSMLKIWSILFDLKAITLKVGFMIALSTAMNFVLKRVWGSAMSMMTTFCSSPTLSRTQINLSDSTVTLLKPMSSGFMPKVVSYSWDNKAMLIKSLERPICQRPHLYRTTFWKNYKWNLHWDAPETWLDSHSVQPFLYLTTKVNVCSSTIFNQECCSRKEKTYSF